MRSYLALLAVPVVLWLAFAASQPCAPQSPHIQIGNMLVAGCR